MHREPLSNRLCDNPRMNDENDEINGQQSLPTITCAPIGHPLDPQADEVACRVFQVLDRLDGPSRRKHPALLTFFLLYCTKQMSVVEIARKCRCSVGTDSNRVKLSDQTTGDTPAR